MERSPAPTAPLESPARPAPTRAASWRPACRPAGVASQRPFEAHRRATLGPIRARSAVCERVLIEADVRHEPHIRRDANGSVERHAINASGADAELVDVLRHRGVDTEGEVGGCDPPRAGTGVGTGCSTADVHVI